MSSRNQRLSPDERLRALALSRALAAVCAALRARASVSSAIDDGAAILAEAGITPEYLAVVDPDTLVPADPHRMPAAGQQVQVLIAAPVGPVRLIDNMFVTIPAPVDGAPA
jgi:pantoate--beta-alanine ligase